MKPLRVIDVVWVLLHPAGGIKRRHAALAASRSSEARLCLVSATDPGGEQCTA